MIEIHFTRREGEQDEIVLANLHIPEDKFVVGGFYWIEIQPAFPH